MKRRVAITGIGLIGPTGIGLDAFWASLVECRSGIERISSFDTSSYVCQIGGEVRDRSYEGLLEPRKLRTSTRNTVFAIAASELALRDARIPDGLYDPLCIGVSLGTALGGWREGEQQSAVLHERGAQRVNPFLVNGAANHVPALEVASTIGAKGFHATFSIGCPAGLQAIAHGADLIAKGDLEMCLAGGVETPLTPLVLAGMGRTMELSTLNEDPASASRPFDERHSGMVLSEGACVLVLESADNVAQRNGTVHAEIRGYGSSCDARGMYAIDPSGETGARAIHQALIRSDLGATDIGYVCANANSSKIFDHKDTLVIKKAFGEWAARLPVSSIKGVLGHPFGASGAFQVAASSQAIQHGIIPPTHNLSIPAPECDLDYVPGSPRPVDLRNVLVTSHGYGGLNAYLVVSKFGD